MSLIDKTDLKYNRDYTAVYDDTMARFWPLNDRAEKEIRQALADTPERRFVTNDQLKEMGTYQPDGRFGKLIFVLDEGLLIIPSYMGGKIIPGMHGYLADNKYSYSMCLTNQKYDKKLNCITDIHQLMKDSLL